MNTQEFMAHNNGRRRHRSTMTATPGTLLYLCKAETANTYENNDAEVEHINKWTTILHAGSASFEHEL
jgi:hypothetical protein